MTAAAPFIAYVLFVAVLLAVVKVSRRRRPPTDYPSENGDGED